MIFKIKRRERGFVQIDNAILENPKLSWKAKGLLSYLLSRPDDWRVMMGDLAARSTDGPTAIRSALVELRGEGYVRLERARSTDGTLEGSYWTVFEERQVTEIQETLIPDDTEMQVSRKSEKPEVGETPSTNKDSTTKKERGRNLLFDALCAVDCANPDEAIKSPGSKIGKCLSIIKRMTPEVTPEEIKRRANNYRLSWPTATLTATALANNWAKFGTAHAIPQKPNSRSLGINSNILAIEEHEQRVAAGQV